MERLDGEYTPIEDKIGCSKILNLSNFGAIS